MTDKTGVARAFGVATTITFTTGVATASGGNNGSMTLYKAETVDIGATNGGGVSAAGGDRLHVVVSAAALDHLVLSPNPATVVTGQGQAYTARGQDAFNNDIGDVTSVTLFTIGPDGSCSGTTCTPAHQGTHTVTGTKDGKTGQATLNVNKANTTTALTSSSSSSVYGSPPTFTAIVTANSPGSGTPTGKVDFKDGSNPLCTDVSLDGTGTATCTPSSSALNVGSHSITAYYKGDGDYNTSTSNTLTHTVTPACVGPIGSREYIGTNFAWTTSPTSSRATLTLSAGLKACTLGDIRTARVTFAIRNGSTWSAISGASNLPVGLVDPGDTSQGTATAIVQYNIGSASAADLEVAIIVTGNFAQNDPVQDALVTIAKPPGTNSILGGGEIGNGTESRGFIKGANGDITQFFLNVTYNKSGTNPQGKVTIIVHSYNNPNGTPSSSLRTYKITSTSIAVLAANTNLGTASFSSKATLQDITNPSNPISIDGGATLQVEMVDGDKGTVTNPGVGDTISLYLLNKSGGVWFANKLDANLKGVQVPVLSGTGDIVVK